MQIPETYIIETTCIAGGYHYDWHTEEGPLARTEAEAVSQAAELLRWWGDDLLGLRVTRFGGDCPARDVTEDVLRAVAADWDDFPHPLIEAYMAGIAA